MAPLVGFPVVSVVKNPPADTEDKRDAGSVPGLGISAGEGNGNSFPRLREKILQYT